MAGSKALFPCSWPGKVERSERIKKEGFNIVNGLFITLVLGGRILNANFLSLALDSHH